MPIQTTKMAEIIIIAILYLPFNYLDEISMPVKDSKLKFRPASIAQRLLDHSSS